MTEFNPLTPLFDDAVLYAIQLHRDQPRKGSTTPYIAHLLAVTAIVLENGGDEELAIAAVLHDAVEDQGGMATLENIRRRFGDIVAEIVLDVSDTMENPKPPWRARKEAYIAHLLHASDGSLLVSLADKLHNARSILMDLHRIGEATWERFTGGKPGTLWYYRSLVEVFKNKSNSPLVDEFTRVVHRMEHLALGDQS